MYWLTGILGVALAIAPFVLGYTSQPAALWTSIIAGLGVVMVSVLEATAHDKENWEYWIAGILGIAALAAPFVLGFNTITTAMWTSVIAGGLIAVFAGTRLFTRLPKT